MRFLRRRGENGAVTDAARLRFPVVPGQLRMREGGLAGRRDGRKKEGERVAERACYGPLLPRSGEGRVTGGRRRELRCRGGRQRSVHAPHGCRRRGLAAGEEEKGRPATALCHPRSPRQSDPGVVRRNPSVGQRCLCVTEPLPCPGARRHPALPGSRSGEGGAGKTYPALAKQNNVRFLPLVFSADVTGSPLI